MGPATSQEAAMPRLRVLVVDDEPMVTEVVERYLVRDGFDVSTADDGDAALALAQTWAPDLIVLDLMLPGKDGLEVCRTLRRDSSVPIIMLTARGDETDRIVVSKSAPMTTSSSRSHRGSSWRASRPFCAAPPRKTTPRLRLICCVSRD